MPIEHITDFNEAVAIIEHRLDVEIERRHLVAVVEMVEAREATISTLRGLLNEAMRAGEPQRVKDPLYQSSLKNRVANALATTWPQKDFVA